MSLMKQIQVMASGPHEALGEEIIMMIVRMQTEIERRDTALQSLTPGGSEYVNNPEECVKYVKGLQRRQHETIVRLIRET